MKQEVINLLCLVYLVDRTTLKDQFDIKVSTLFRNMYEERHAEEHTQVTATMTIHPTSTLQMLEHTRTIEANQANVYEFHLSAIIDMLGELQKKLDAELHDAQEDENNAADPIFFNSVRGTPWYLVPDDTVQSSYHTSHDRG